MDAQQPQRSLPRAWYSASIADFLQHSSTEVIGQLVSRSNREVGLDQRDAWQTQVHLLKRGLQGRHGTLLLEFNIPRMGLRADAVILLAGCIVILEFKVGEKLATRAALAQTWEYALDTKNFHEPSHGLPIIPVLVPTAGAIHEPPPRRYADDGVAEPITLAPAQIPALLDELCREHAEPIDPAHWVSGRYRPTPTIIEAARHLYANHGVAEITRTEAGATNLSQTAGRLEALIQRVMEAEYGAGEPLRLARSRQRTEVFDDLHLTVSLRSFRAEKVSAFVKALLHCDPETAGSELASFRERYPIVITRDLDAAKRWVRQQARGKERYGLLASSKAMRLKPHAIEVRLAADPVHYFLSEPDDVRSAYYLEECATEFQVQGLEIDWACVTWDADLRRGRSGWSHHDFRGSRWTNVNSEENRRNLKNAYRVLLTRARQGMVIFVPRGATEDPTRAPAFYDPTFEYLTALGLTHIA